MSGTITLILSGLLPAILSVGFYMLEKRTAFAKASYWLRQAVIGIAFGALAMLSTVWGVEIGGASINARDAAPLAAGLIFGAPAGIIAGVLGGVFRWLAALWGVGEYTRLACSLATVLAGFFGAGARKFLFDGKKPGWFYAMAIGVTTEVLHMLMIFLTNMSDTYRAFVMVRQCTGIMVLANGLSVTLSVLLVSALGKEKRRGAREAKKLVQSFQRWLLLCVCAAFTATCLFTWALQSQIAETNANSVLSINAQDARGDIQDAYEAEGGDIRLQVARVAQNRHIGQNGCVVICDENGVVIGDRDGHEDDSMRELMLRVKEDGIPEGARFSASVRGAESYCAYAVAEGYFVLAALPKDEAEFTRDISVYITIFMEIVVFAALFTHIYFLIKKLVVDKLRRINGELSQITGGNLNVTVDVRSNAEFASLSDDINSTVTTLKSYIAEAAARIDKELEFARAIQHAALPSIFPPYPGRRDFDIYARMDAAKEVGGDFYDFYLLDSNTLAILIADVSGKGIPAAMFMMTAKTLLKGLAESGLDVDELFTRANEKLCGGNEAGMFVTAWMGIIDLRTGRMRYANAGHNPPAVRRGNGAFELLRGKPRLVLAGMEKTIYGRCELRLMPGDTLYLYTDGVTEATNAANLLFGEERLLDILNDCPRAGAEALCRRVKRAVEAFVADAPQFDDMTMLSFRLCYLQSGDSIITIPNETSAELVADFVDIRVRQLSIPEKAASKLHIAADEIFANISAYSGAAKVQVELRLEDGEALLRFTDDGKPYDPTQEREPDISAPLEERETGGLGIFMVRRLTRSVEYEYSEGLNGLTLRLEI